MEKFKFKFERDECNKHYSYLFPLDERTENIVLQSFDEVWFDGTPYGGAIVLYNGKIINRK